MVVYVIIFFLKVYFICILGWIFLLFESKKRFELFVLVDKIIFFDILNFILWGVRFVIIIIKWLFNFFGWL